MSQIETSDQNFDLALLMEIADGSDEFLVESIGMFLVQTPELMGEIYKGIQAQDRDLLAKSAHKLKANLGFFGMDNGQAIMVEIEHLAKGGADFNEIIAKYNLVSGIIQPTLVKLQQIKIAKGG